MLGKEESLPRPNYAGSLCAHCGHPQEDHPLNDVCWHDVIEGGTVKLCSCPGFKATPQACGTPERAC